MKYHENYLIESDRKLKVPIEDRKIDSFFQARATSSSNTVND